MYIGNERFIFELLQNADDNLYRKAVARGEDPYVSFDIDQARIIIESNEDGFTSENVKAICSYGESSKRAGQDCIGEKGLGFKSVFMVARKVHIQSNDYSFTFTYEKDDPGIGMIIPTWEDPLELIPGLTRITLFLHRDDKGSDQQSQQPIIQKQFEDIQGANLLFLRKLREIRITTYGHRDCDPKNIRYSVKHGKDRAEISTRTIHDGEVSFEKQVYHITKHQATDIPRSEHRKYLAGETPPDKTPEIVLAFPLTKGNVPVLSDQPLFAFLPMKSVGFKVSDIQTK